MPDAFATPPSIGTAVMVVASLALVLNQTARGGNRSIAKVAESLRTKSKDALEAALAVEAIKKEATQALAGAQGAPAEITDAMERVSGLLVRFKPALVHLDQAASAFDDAARLADRIEPSFERAYPGWRRTRSKLEPITRQLRAEIAAAIAKMADPMLATQLDELIALSLVEQGLNAWRSDLEADEDDAPLFDPADAQPIHWDPASGWAEGTR